jgi:DNA mismatch repair protein MutS
VFRVARRAPAQINLGRQGIDCEFPLENSSNGLFLMTLETSAHNNEIASGFRSILYLRSYDEATPPLKMPDSFPDLLLDQIVESITAGREESQLVPLFYDHLSDTDEIKFRHEVWRDLENSELTDTFRAFTQTMRDVRLRLTSSKKTRFTQQARGFHLDAVVQYCKVIQDLVVALNSIDLSSRGLLDFRTFITSYMDQSEFRSLVFDSQRLKLELSEIRYNINLRGPRIRVLRYEGETDYGSEIEEAFERFQQGAVTDYRVKYSDWPDMNHVESSIADRVALLFPKVFRSLQTFCDQTSGFFDANVSKFEREIQFYLAYLDYITPIRSLGLSFSLPTLQVSSKSIEATETFDLALAAKLARSGVAVVTNDFQLHGAERIIVVSGPNQGGKTTFARTFGQLHYFANIGCPVPGNDISLFLFDELFTHFGREEDPTYQSGKLEDDLLRMQNVLQSATSRSVIVMNEIFASTTTQDAVSLGTRVIEKVVELDALCVIVTFIDELTLLSPSIVSMTSTVIPENPVERTFKIVRHAADGLAFAMAIADKYGLTYQQLRERLAK